MSEDVVFRRIGGRVVPIKVDRNKTPQPKKKKVDSALKEVGVKLFASGSVLAGAGKLQERFAKNTFQSAWALRKRGQDNPSKRHFRRVFLLTRPGSGTDVIQREMNKASKVLTKSALRHIKQARYTTRLGGVLALAGVLTGGAGIADDYQDR
jgi:hypothetical protein